jgi:hypothetical protein
MSILAVICVKDISLKALPSVLAVISGKDSWQLIVDYIAHHTDTNIEA